MSDADDPERALDTHPALFIAQPSIDCVANKCGDRTVNGCRTNGQRSSLLIRQLQLNSFHLRRQ